MKNTVRAVWPVVLVATLLLPVLAFGQVLTRDGDPVMSVTDPAKATRESLSEAADQRPRSRSLWLRRQQMQLALMARLRAYFFAGILVTAPVSITVSPPS